MDRVSVKLGSDSYDIIVGQNITEHLENLYKEVGNFSKIAIISDFNVSRLYLGKIKKSLSNSEVSVCSLEISDGEGTKDWKNLKFIVEWLIENKIDRDGLIIALGGGVIGDLVGFAASITKRGISLVQMPTTLLSQVDSSVGGKTAINSVSGKNLIGTFFQPKMVLTEINTLNTLTERHFLSGMGEVIKYGLISDKTFFSWIEKNIQQIKVRNPRIISEMILKSCKIKAKIVEKDEKEKGSRALLNLGHTFGHALEAFTGYSNTLLHGEAVAIGTVLAFRFSEFLKKGSLVDIERVTSVYAKLGMKHRLKDIPAPLPNTPTLLDFMLQDKKMKNDRLVFILPTRLGHCIIDDQISMQTLHSFLEKCL